MKTPPDPLKKNFAIREFTSARPKLRDDVQFHFDSFRGQTFCIIEDPLTSQFFKVGTAEYHFIKHLDGKHTVAEALAKMAHESRARAIDEQQAFQILNQLLESQLIQTDQSSEASVITEKTQDTRHKKLKSKLNPLFIKFPLFNPDRTLARMLPIINFFMGYPFLFIWLLLATYSIYHLDRHWEYIAFATPQAFLPNNWIYLLLSWSLLKCIHELFHGFAVKKFGGTVPECGLMFILFTPMGYVDATSSWRIRSKWKRIVVGLSGMYIELFLAAIGMLVWLNTEPSGLNSFAYNIMITGSIVTLFFNANPLMRFDGYYILSDFLEIPNLYSLGISRAKAIGRRYIMGIKGIKIPSILERDQFWITAYGIGAVLWKVILLTTLTITASFLFKGFGIVLAAISAISWFGRPIYNFSKYLIKGNQSEHPRPSQYLPRMAILALILTVIAYIPIQPTITLNGVIYNQNAEIIRTECPGFIEKQFITEKQSINEGDLLILLSNEDETTELSNLNLELKQSQIRASMFLSNDETARYQAELETIKSLKTQITEKQEFVDTLSIRAPTSGVIIPSPEDWEDGAFVADGTPLFTIYPNERTEATIAIDQKNAEPFQKHLNKAALFKLKGTPIILQGTLYQFNPRGTQSLPHPSLAASNGGPLAVLPGSGDGDKEPELLSPHFSGAMTINIPENTNILEGQLGILKFESHNSKFLWKLAYESINQYLEAVIETARQATQTT